MIAHHFLANHHHQWQCHRCPLHLFLKAHRNSLDSPQIFTYMGPALTRTLALTRPDSCVPTARSHEDDPAPSGTTRTQIPHWRGHWRGPTRPTWTKRRKFILRIVNFWVGQFGLIWRVLEQVGVPAFAQFCPATLFFAWSVPSPSLFLAYIIV